MLWDTHMHCAFSGDSDADPELMIQSAIKKQLDGICFTHHLDYDYPEEPELFLLDFPAYQERIFSLKEKYKKKISVLWGIELGLQPHLAKRLSDVTDGYPFDFVIGSSHVVHGKDPYYFSFFDGKTEQEAYTEYFVSILENLDAFTDFDVYGHIDYVVRYGPNRNADYTYAKYADVLDEILKKLISLGRGIEINTGGFKYGLGHPNPSEEILSRYHELGGEILTIGADAHQPEHVAYDFKKVPDLLKACGFSYYTVFQNRKPEFYKLP